MGMVRDAGACEIDLVKEMAEGLGSTGLKLEDLLEKAAEARKVAVELSGTYACGGPDSPDLTVVNESIKEFNVLVEKAEDALRWLLIQREACGFRTHRNVHVHYPIPPKMKPLK